MDESTHRMPAVEPHTHAAPTAPTTGASHPPLTQTLCPYCGVRIEDGPNAARCGSCKGLLDPLSRQATQNAMGPWAVRDEANPFNPGCSFETIRALIARGRIRRDTVIRGPSTRQFWMFAGNTPGIASLLGECHACHQRVAPDEFLCSHCGAALTLTTDRQSLGLAPMRLLPGAASAPAIAASAVRTPSLPPAAAATNTRFIETPPTLRRGSDPIAAMSPPPEESAAAALARRRHRDRTQSLTVALIIAVAVVAVVLVLFVVLAVRSGLESQKQTAAPPPAPASNSPSPTPPVVDPVPAAVPPIADPEPAPAPEPAVQPMPIVAGAEIDRGLEQWHDRIAEAMALEATDQLADLDRAIEILDAVMTEATSGDPRNADRFPILRARIAVMRERSADRHARNQ